MTPTDTTPAEALLTREEFGDKMAARIVQSRPPVTVYETFKQRFKRYIDCAYQTYLDSRKPCPTQPAEALSEREAFEQMAATEGYDISRWKGLGCRDARYNNDTTQTAWEWFQAGREYERTRPTPQPDADKLREASEIICYVRMRLAQIASGDYKACGHTAEQVAADALMAIVPLNLILRLLPTLLQRR